MSNIFSKAWHEVTNAGNWLDKNVWRPATDFTLNMMTMGGYSLYQGMKEQQKQTEAMQQYYANQTALAQAAAAEAGRQATLQANEEARRQQIANTIAQMPTVDTRKVQVAMGDMANGDISAQNRKRQFQIPEGDQNFLVPISINTGGAG